MGNASTVNCLAWGKDVRRSTGQGAGAENAAIDSLCPSVAYYRQVLKITQMACWCRPAGCGRESRPGSHARQYV